MTKRAVFTTSSIVAVLIVVGLITWLFLSGQVALVINKPNDDETKVVKGTVALVCGETTVNAFNEATTGYPTADPMTSAIKVDVLAEVAENVKKKANYQQDPTCQTILFWTAAHERKFEEAKDAKKATDALYADGHFANSKLRVTAPLQDWQLMVDSLSPEAQNIDRSEGNDD